MKDKIGDILEILLMAACVMVEIVALILLILLTYGVARIVLGGC